MSERYEQNAIGVGKKMKELRAPGTAKSVWY